MTHLSIQKAHVFTQHLQGGNPAGIVLTQATLSNHTMRCIADILNPVSETVFIFPSETADYRFRFFTSLSEIGMCAHATIGAFFALHRKISSQEDMVTCQVETACGVFPVTLHFTDGTLTTVMMNQGVPTLIDPSVDPAPLCEILSISSTDLMSTLPLQILSTGRPKLMVPLRSRDILNNLHPDFSHMIAFCDEIGATGVHVFTFDTVDAHSFIHCRHFAPGVGVDEDPATGNSNAALAGYLLNNDKLRGEHFTVEQGYAMGRPSHLQITVDSQTGEVSVGGHALIVMEGTLFLDSI